MGNGSWVGSLNRNRSSCQYGCDLQEIHASGSGLTERAKHRRHSSLSAYGLSGHHLSSNSTAQVRQMMNADGARIEQVCAPLSGLRVLHGWHTTTEQARRSPTPRSTTACGGWCGYGLALDELAGSIEERSAPASAVVLYQDM